MVSEYIKLSCALAGTPAQGTAGRTLQIQRRGQEDRAPATAGARPGPARPTAVLRAMRVATAVMPVRRARITFVMDLATEATLPAAWPASSPYLRARRSAYLGGSLARCQPSAPPGPIMPTGMAL